MSLDLTRRRLLAMVGAPAVLAALPSALHAAEGFDHATPISVAEVTIRVRNLDEMVAFYRTTLGLRVMERSDTHGALGAGGRVLLRLVAAPQAQIAAPTSAGLYHVAYLMPSEQDFARWIAHVAERRVRIDGASDHDVSVAIYLTDPEGNGIEVAYDRPPQDWLRMAGEVVMGNAQPDLGRLLSQLPPEAAPYKNAPDATRIGHVHLKVGDLKTGKAFWQEALGFEVTAFSRPRALFMASGGYHHHLAINTWHSDGAGPRGSGFTGLDHLVLEVRGGDLLKAQQKRLSTSGAQVVERAAGTAWLDPWGTGVVLREV